MNPKQKRARRYPGSTIGAPRARSRPGGAFVNISERELAESMPQRERIECGRPVIKLTPKGVRAMGEIKKKRMAEFEEQHFKAFPYQMREIGSKMKRLSELKEKREKLIEDFPRFDKTVERLGKKKKRSIEEEKQYRQAKACQSDLIGKVNTLQLKEVIILEEMQAMFKNIQKQQHIFKK